MKRRSFLALSSASLVFSPWALASGDSARPLRLVVPFPAGGATDITARILSEPLSRILRQPVIVDNRSGAGGSIGMAEVARSAPDGLTLGLATLSTHGVNPAVYKGLPYDPLKDFVAVTEVVQAPGVLVVNPSVPATDLGSFVKYLKANPGKLSYASAGNGTIGHMWAEQFKNATGTQMLHVPYRGAGPALNDVMAGQVGAYFDQVASSLPFINATKLRALAVSWNGRLDALPQVPTYAEQGLASNNDPSWFGLVAPSKTPPAVVQRLQEAVAAAIHDADVKAKLVKQGLYAAATTPEAFAGVIRRDIERMRTVSQQAGITLD